MFCSKHRKTSATTEKHTGGNWAFTHRHPRTSTVTREAMNSSTASKRPGCRQWLRFHASCFPLCISSSHLKVKRNRKAEALKKNGACVTRENQGKRDYDDDRGKVSPSVAVSDFLVPTPFRPERLSVPNDVVLPGSPEQAKVSKHAKEVQNKNRPNGIEKELRETFAVLKWRSEAKRQPRDRASVQEKNGAKARFNDLAFLPAVDFPFFLALLSECDTYLQQKTNLRGESSDIGLAKERKCVSVPATSFPTGESGSGRSFQVNIPISELRTEERNTEAATSRLSEFGPRKPSSTKRQRVFYGKNGDCFVEDRINYEQEYKQESISDEDTFVSREEPCSENQTGPPAGSARDEGGFWDPMNTSIFDLPGSVEECFLPSSVLQESSRFCRTLVEIPTEDLQSPTAREDGDFALRVQPLECQKTAVSGGSVENVTGEFGKQTVRSFSALLVAGRERQGATSLLERDERPRGTKCRTKRRTVRNNSEEVVSRREGRTGCVCKKRRPCGRCGEHVMKQSMRRERQAKNNGNISIRTPFCSEGAMLQEGNSSSTSASYGGTSQNGTMSFTCLSRSSSFSSRHTQIHPSLETPEGLSVSGQYRLTKSMISRNLTLLSSPERGECPKPTDLEDDAHAPLSPSFCVFVSPEDTTGAEEGEAQRPLFCQEALAFMTFAATESGRTSGNDILQYLHNSADRVCSSGTKRMDQDEESRVGEDKKRPSVFRESAHGEVPNYRHILRQSSSVSDARDESPGSSSVLKGVESVAGSLEADTKCESENPSSCKNARIEGVTPPREVVRERRRRTKRRRVSLTTVSRRPPLFPEQQSVCTNHRKYRSAPKAICSVEEFIDSNLLSEPSPPNGENVTLEMGEAETAVELSSQPEKLRSDSRSPSHSPGVKKEENHWSETESFLSFVGEGIVSVLGRGAGTLQNILLEKALQHWAEEAASVTSETSLEEGRTQGESYTETRRRKRPLPDFSCSLPFSCNKGATCSFSSFSASSKQVCTQEAIWRECSRHLKHRGDGTDTSPVCCNIERNEGQTDAIVDHLSQPIQHRECTALQMTPKKDQQNSYPSGSSYLVPKKRLAMLQRPSSSPFVFPYSSPAKLPTCFSPLQAVSSSFTFMPCGLPRTEQPGAIPFCPFPSYSPKPTCGKSSDRSACRSFVALPWQTSRENFQQRGDLLRSASRHVRRISSLTKRRTTAANGQRLKPDPVKRGGSSEFSCRSWPAETTKSRFSGPRVNRVASSPSLVAVDSNKPEAKKEETYKLETSSPFEKLDSNQDRCRFPASQGQRYVNCRSTLLSPGIKGFPPSLSTSACVSFSSLAAASPFSSLPRSTAFSKAPGAPLFGTPFHLQTWLPGGRPMKQKCRRDKPLRTFPCSRPIPCSSVALSTRRYISAGSINADGRRRARPHPPAPIFLQRIRKSVMDKEMWSPRKIIPVSPLLLPQLNARLQPIHQPLSSYPSPASVPAGMLHRRGISSDLPPQFRGIIACKRIEPIYIIQKSKNVYR